MSDAWIFENGFFGWTVPKEAWILSGTNFPPLEIGYRMLDTREKAINILTIQIRNNWSLRKHHLKLVEGRNQMKLNERDESWSGLWKISRIWRYSASISTNTYFLTSFVVDVNTSFLTQVGSSIKEMVRSFLWSEDLMVRKYQSRNHVWAQPRKKTFAGWIKEKDIPDYKNNISKGKGSWITQSSWEILSSSVWLER